MVHGMATVGRGGVYPGYSQVGARGTTRYTLSGIARAQPMDIGVPDVPRTVSQTSQERCPDGVPDGVQDEVHNGVQDEVHNGVQNGVYSVQNGVYSAQNGVYSAKQCQIQ